MSFTNIHVISNRRSILTIPKRLKSFKYFANDGSLVCRKNKLIVFNNLNLIYFDSSKHYVSNHSKTPDNSKSTELIEKKEKTSYSKMAKQALKGGWDSIVDIVKNPKKTWKVIKEEAAHYWLGSKLLWAEIKLTSQILRRVARGHMMTRRERMQLLRTSNDLFRLVPFAFFIIVPFMEFLLPFALKVFPNMLPSTFQDSLKKEENMKKELQMRLALAGFLQDTMKGIVVTQKRNSNEEESGATEVLSFIEKARLGEKLPNDLVIKIAKMFKDEFLLDNIARPQLVSLCQYMNIRPFGADSFLRFQIRNKIRVLKEDDRRILWEGIDSLTIDEMREACQERGMRSFGLTHFGYKRQLEDWLDLSIQKSIPISLLIMSRAFNLKSATEFEPEDVLKSSLSSLADETINEVVIAAALTKEKSVDITKRKLESIQYQSELIQVEQEENDDAIEAIEQQKATDLEHRISETMLSDSLNTNSAKTDEEAGECEEKRSDSQMLSVHEIEALGDLARGSSVVREKAELAKLQAHIDTLGNVSVSEDVSTNVVETAIESEDTVESKNLLRMQGLLDRMMGKLKIQIDTTEKALENKLNILDQDGDGQMSSEELKDAITKILKRVSTEQEAEEIVQFLDKDKDGKVSVIELLQYAESRKHKSEVENLEQQLTPKSNE